MNEFSVYTRLIPANEIYDWVDRQIISESGNLYNPDHFHLHTADIAFMWASSAFEKKGRTVLGQCEEVMMRAGGWQKARMEQQMHEWFGRIPTFIITLAADYCAQCSDLDFCALIEHELYHICHATDMFHTTRERFQNEIADIPIANKAYRLRVLDRMATKAESMKNMALTASLMEQAAKEVGDAYSNKQKVELTGKDGGPVNQVNYTPEDYTKAQAALENQLPDLD
nr:putative metallopeptidase [Pectobacterium polaris]